MGGVTRQYMTHLDSSKMLKVWIAGTSVSEI